MSLINREQPGTVRNLMRLCAITLAFPVLCNSTTLYAQGYSKTFLVSDIPGLGAFTDTNLVNAWGMAVLPDDMLLVNANENALAGAYLQDGQPTGIYIGLNDGPSGLLVNQGGGFKISDGKKSQPSTFIFVTESGTIQGWNANINVSAAVTAADNSAFDAVYKGVAQLGDRLYAANFKVGVIDMYDSHWNWLGAFTDSRVDPGFAPFNVAAINGQLYVTFAMRLPPDFHDDEAGPGNGYVDVFNPDGHFVRRLISHGALNSPWGLALAPDNFGPFSKSLLVGNFGDGVINAYDPQNGAWLGAISDAGGNAIHIGGLWALEFKTGDMNGGKDKPKGKNHHTNSPPVLFFSAGPNGEGDGVVGEIMANED
jgi:uncharacterized protein (TIGR03118 family)